MRPSIILGFRNYNTSIIQYYLYTGEIASIPSVFINGADFIANIIKSRSEDNIKTLRLTKITVDMMGGLLDTLKPLTGGRSWNLLASIKKLRK